MRFKENWDNSWAKIWFYRKSTIKYMSKSKKIKQNWTRLQTFNICFCVNINWSLLLKSNLWREDWILAYVSRHFWALFISYFSKILNFKSFDNSWNNSYIKFFLLGIKFRFTCGELALRGNAVNCKRIMQLIFWKFIICISRRQQWFKFLEIALLWLNTVKSIKKIPTVIKIFLISFFDLKETWKLVPKGNTSIWNFPSTSFVYIFIKSLTKASKFLRRFEVWRRLWLVMNFEGDFD